MKIHTIGIDLGKTSFHLVGLNERGEVAVGLPGLLANNEMAQRSNPALSKPVLGRSLPRLRS